VANDFQYYKYKIDSFDNEGYDNNSYNGVHEYKRMQVNFDLFNNILNVKDLEYVCNPIGMAKGELPATMANRDISSMRIKALLGMEMNRPFGFKVIATNPEATTRKEQHETDMLKEFVVQSIMRPIQQETELKYAQELEGGISPQRRQEIMQQVAQETQAKTPIEVRRYMQRDHQDPSEVQGNQILNYLMKEQDIRRKFNNAFKYGMLSAYEVLYIGIINGKPVIKTVNTKRFNCHKSPDNDFIEDGEWATCEFRMNRSEVVKTFDLTSEEIDSIYSEQEYFGAERFRSRMFEDDEPYYEDEDERDTIKVLHVQWKGLRKVGWLDYIDEDGILQTKFLVDENYKLNKAAGDVRIKWEWIPITEEGYKIGPDIYKNMGPVPGQHKDLSRLKECKLSYVGVIYDNMNSQPTCPMDRMRYYQYLTNIVWYRIELLMASDKGKKLLMNLNSIPESSGIDIHRWQYVIESTPYAWYSSDEEGMTGQDVNTIAKVIDMSLVSDIAKYMDILEKLDYYCGRSVGVTDPVLGQTAVSERVSNNQQNLIQTSNILEPYFDLHNAVKRNSLQMLLNVAKTAYISSGTEELTYVLDDMSTEILKLDINLLELSTLGLFVENSAMAEKAKQTVEQLAHAAMQNQTIELSDVIAVIKQDSVQEAEEALKAAEQVREERTQAAVQQEQNFKAQEEQKKRDEAKVIHARKLEEIRVKAQEDRKTKVLESTITSLGFNPDKDFDDDGELDILEVARDGINARIALAKSNREDKELQFKIDDAKEKNKLKEKEISKKSVAK
jgi:hypothetical protein